MLDIKNSSSCQSRCQNEQPDTILESLLDSLLGSNLISGKPADNERISSKPHLLLLNDYMLFSIMTSTAVFSTIQTKGHFVLLAHLFF